jgi:hypothetical protein
MIKERAHLLISRFEKSWIKEEDFLAIVDRAWQQSVRANISLDRLQK